jgi:hypothetical protein
MNSAIQEVQAGDALESVMKFLFTTDSISDYEMVVVICEILMVVK